MATAYEVELLDRYREFMLSCPSREQEAEWAIEHPTVTRLAELAVLDPEYEKLWREHVVYPALTRLGLPRDLAF